MNKAWVCHYWVCKWMVDWQLDSRMDEIWVGKWVDECRMDERWMEGRLLTCWIVFTMDGWINDRRMGQQIE